MEPSVVRPRPIWKSTRPNDPAGTSSPNKNTSTSQRTDRLSFEVQVSATVVTVGGVILEDSDLATNLASSKMKDYFSETQANVNVVVLVSTGASGSDPRDRLRCLLEVQMLLLEYRPLPVLVVDCVAEGEAAVRRQLSNSSTTLQPERSPTALIAHATASAPAKKLWQQDAASLNSIFTSVKELETGTRTAEGRALIHDFLDPSTARDVIDFWEDEYLAM